MKEDIVFAETQSFRTNYFFDISIIAIDSFLIYKTIRQIVYGEIFGNNPASDIMLLVICAVLLVITVLFFSFTIHSVINQDGIYVKLFPFMFGYKLYRWEEIANVDVIKYNPIRNYRGWGYRTVFARLKLFNLKIINNRAFTVSGNLGMQIEFLTGRKLLIGTRKAEELMEILKKLGKLKD
ncbi:MAG: hypothetical protein LBQ28_07320 [Prevotellaceae bacterium]|jgi:hypothetical protein|nr:hypothetical protein [Prevotellaceae bacterium]